MKRFIDAMETEIRKAERKSQKACIKANTEDTKEAWQAYYGCRTELNAMYRLAEAVYAALTD